MRYSPTVQPLPAYLRAANQPQIIQLHRGQASSQEESDGVAQEFPWEKMSQSGDQWKGGGEESVRLQVMGVIFLTDRGRGVVLVTSIVLHLSIVKVQ